MCLYQGERRLSRRRPLIRLLKGGMRDLIWLKIFSQTFSERIFSLTYIGVRFLFPGLYSTKDFFFGVQDIYFFKSPITPPPPTKKKSNCLFLMRGREKKRESTSFFFLFFLGRVQFSLPNRRFLFKAGLR